MSTNATPWGIVRGDSARHAPMMVAKVSWKDPAHFDFKAVATESEDPGLNFGK